MTLFRDLSGEPVSGVLSAENTFVGPLQFRGAGNHEFTILIEGSYVGTLTLQMKTPDGSYSDVEDLTADANTPKRGKFQGPVDVRCGFKSSNYTSGSPTITLNP